MDEFVPGNTDPERRGRVAYERMTATAVRSDAWVMLSPELRQAWCHAAEAAFEEGRAFERERQRAHFDEDFDPADCATYLRQHGYRVTEP